MLHKSLPFRFLKMVVSKSGWLSVVSRWRTEGGAATNSGSGSTFLLKLAPDLNSDSFLTLNLFPELRVLRVRPQAHVGSTRQQLPSGQVKPTSRQHHIKTSIPSVVGSQDHYYHPPVACTGVKNLDIVRQRLVASTQLEQRTNHLLFHCLNCLALEDRLEA